MRLISFTGSTRVGRLLMEQCAPGIKRLALELGGHAPVVVCDDADIKLAADQIIAAKFRVSGQTCVCPNRIIVADAVHDRLVDALAEGLTRLVVGPGSQPGVTVGPLIDRRAWDKVHAHVEDALAGGAQRVLGDEPSEPTAAGGWFYPPTLLTGVQSTMQCCREETFGPVLPVLSAGDDAELVRLACDSPYGLAAYVFAGTATRAERIAAALPVGHVGINSGTGPTPEAPFGGCGLSGFGREGGSEGLLEFTEQQTVAIADP